jgi:hypothetical protein
MHFFSKLSRSFGRKKDERVDTPVKGKQQPSATERVSSVTPSSPRKSDVSTARVKEKERPTSVVERSPSPPAARPKSFWAGASTRTRTSQADDSSPPPPQLDLSLPLNSFVLAPSDNSDVPAELKDFLTDDEIPIDDALIAQTKLKPLEVDRLVSESSAVIHERGMFFRTFS